MKTNPNYVKEFLPGNNDRENGEPFTAREKEIKKGLERVQQLKDFLNDAIPFNYNNMVCGLFPDSVEKDSFIWESTKECRDRFYNWIKSGPGLAALWQFEKSLLINEYEVKKYFYKRTFFIDYMNRLRQIYRRLEHDESIKIFDKRDFLALYLFFSQIERFVIKDIGQTEPMTYESLKALIFDWFYTNMNDVTEISGYTDKGKLVIIQILPYRYNDQNSSIIPNTTGDRHYYKLDFFEDSDYSAIHENFDTMEDSEDFDNLLSKFTVNNWVSDYFLDLPF